MTVARDWKELAKADEVFEKAKKKKNLIQTEIVHSYAKKPLKVFLLTVLVMTLTTLLPAGGRHRIYSFLPC